MDDFINQAACRCKTIFEINVIALVFMCCRWSINWGKTVLEPTQIPLHLGFLWDTVQGTIVLPEEKTSRLVDWTSKLLQVQSTNLEVFSSGKTIVPRTVSHRNPR